MIGNGIDLQTVIWAVMAILVTGGAAIWARKRAAAENAGGPGVIASLLIWAATIAFVVLLVQGVDFWERLFSIFS
ncbi:MAG: hypothetical protein KF779_10260 [Hyphomonadaceae bacterium]|nr:hypothetical protein [Hyphomonadaceae bacterium]MCA8886985.1 hypothetical protein [Hyphomonadaceae bacterium]